MLFQLKETWRRGGVEGGGGSGWGRGTCERALEASQIGIEGQPGEFLLQVGFLMCIKVFEMHPHKGHMSVFYWLDEKKVPNAQQCKGTRAFTSNEDYCLYRLTTTSLGLLITKRKRILRCISIQFHRHKHASED